MEPSSSSSTAPAKAKAPAARKKVVNPYAKKKNTVAPAAAAAPAPAHALTSTRGSGPASNPYVKSNKRPREQSQQQQHHREQWRDQQQPLKRRPPPPPVDESTTFSQAFGDTDPDEGFAEQERAQQREFDKSLATPGAGSSNPAVGAITPRDHHALLQSHCLHISMRQQGNPIIKHIRNVPFQYSTMVPDYIFAPTRCALYLTLRYHKLHPNYIHRRVAELRSDFEYRMLLCYVDLDDSAPALLFLNDLCVQNNLTLVLAWSEEEAARYLETVRAFDGKDDSMLRKRDFADHAAQAAHALAAARGVNKTDAAQLLAQFGNFKNLAAASVEELSICPGVGPKKVRRLWEAFHRPFSAEMVRRRKQREERERKKKEEKEDRPVKGGGMKTQEAAKKDPGGNN